MTPNKKWTHWHQSKVYSALKKIYTRFLKIRGEPKEIALGFALGLFIGMTPAIGFHILIAIFFAGLFKWNKISAALAVWITNPITAPFIYSVTYLLGARMMGLNKTQALSNAVSSPTFLNMLKKTPELFGALTIGGAVLGLPLAFIGFYFSYAAIKKYQAGIKRKLAEQKLKYTIKRETRKQRKKRTEKSHQ